MFNLLINKSKLTNWQFGRDKSKFKAGDIVYLWYPALELETENIILSFNETSVEIKEIRGYGLNLKKEFFFSERIDSALIPTIYFHEYLSSKRHLS